MEVQLRMIWWDEESGLGGPPRIETKFHVSSVDKKHIFSAF